MGATAPSLNFFFMLLAQIVRNIQNIAHGGGVPPDDKRLSDRNIKYWISYWRSALVPIVTDYGKLNYPELYQDLGLQTLVAVDKAESNTVTWGENLKKITIPPLVSLPKNRNIIVSLADKQTPIPLISQTISHLSKYRRFTCGKPRAFLVGVNLYIDAPENLKLKYINIKGIFETPETVEACFNEMTDIYPVPGIMIPLIMEKIVSQELNVTLKTQDDVINNARDDSQEKK